MTCTQAQQTVMQWEQSDRVDRDALDAFSAHLSGCQDCQSRFRAILPLMERDAGEVAVLRSDLLPAEGFEGNLMHRLASPERPVRRGRLGLYENLSGRWAMAAAAALVLVALGAVFLHQRAVDNTDQVLVHFVLDAPGAERVALVGNFTDWNPNKLILDRVPGSSQWEISVRLRRGETYLYNFVIDHDLWIPDPARDAQVSDGFGGESTLMQL